MLDVMMFLFPFLLAVIFFGIGLSTLSKHRESAIVFMMFLSPIALFLSGISVPTSAMPDLVVGLSTVLPRTNVLPAYLHLRTMGVGIAEVKPELLKLYSQAGSYAAITIIYLFIRLRVERKKSRYKPASYIL